MLGISWQAEELLAFEEICPLQVGRWLVIFCLALNYHCLVNVAESVLTEQLRNCSVASEM